MCDRNIRRMRINRVSSVYFDGLTFIVWIVLYIARVLAYAANLSNVFLFVSKYYSTMKIIIS